MMPKEVIVGDGFDVVVGWTRDRDVQVATVMRPAQDSDGPKDLRALVASWPDSIGEPATGLYSTLERQQVNDMIRVLRRARDAAYGRDE